MQFILKNPDGFTKEQVRAKYSELNGEGNIEALDIIGEKAQELLTMIEVQND